MESLPLLNLPDGISIWTARDLDDVKRRSLKGNPEDDEFKHNLFSTINILGACSQFSQGLVVPLTTVSRLYENSSYTLYLLTYEGRGVGILKVGLKNLFLTHPVTYQMVEVEPMCVLDFFVDESYQRRGFGERLFRAMLERERLDPWRLAIDRPGPKILSFLQKHYGLKTYMQQANNYVVFDRFFDGTYVTERGMLKWGTPPASYPDSMYSSTLAYGSRKNYHPSAHTPFDLEGDSIARRRSITGSSALGAIDPYNGLPTTNATYGSSGMHNASFYQWGSFLGRSPASRPVTSSFLPPPTLSRLSLGPLLPSPAVAPMMVPLTAHSSRLSCRSSSSGSSNRTLALEGAGLGDLSHRRVSSREWDLDDGLVGDFCRRQSGLDGRWAGPLTAISSGRHTPTESCVEYNIINGIPL
ncbi:unnamed protein product [Phytomonas sp. EM1]|nr:unnamed protein product [Phytomonas sp. EM1]|eukprot:CCW63389.1 unnamed protein product [Phytomonas sp. isolate EM1]